MMFDLVINIVLFFVIVVSFASLLFLLAVARRENSLMDIAYGPLFAIGAWASMFITNSTQPHALIITALITLWALRIGIRIGRKNWGKGEDPRYRAWREAWSVRGPRYVFWRSYLQVFVFQSVIITAIALPFLVAVSAPASLGTWHLVVGVLMFLFGLGYETLADHQLDRFLARKKAGTETATLMTSGLFRYSRRPNYFGETLVWWGLALIVWPLPLGYLAVISPLVITYIVTRITGPMLEDAFLKRYPTEYAAYQASTNYFIPGRPRTIN